MALIFRGLESWSCGSKHCKLIKGTVTDVDQAKT